MVGRHLRQIRVESTFAMVLGIVLTMWAPARGQFSGALSYESGVGKPRSAQGELVEMRLTVRNDATESVTLTFPSSQRFDFVVRHQAKEIWRWSEGKGFLTVIQELSLGPRQTLEYRASWNQRDSAGTMVRPGGYEVVAIFLGATSRGAPPVTLPPRAFTVAAPASSQLLPASRASTIGGRQVGEVLVGEIVVFRLRKAAGGLSAVQRAEVVAERLRRLLHDGLDPSGLIISYVGGDAAVLWRGHLVVTADRQHAILNGTTPTALARKWRDALAGALAIHK